MESSDGIQGRRHAQYHGSRPTLVGGSVRESDGRRGVLRRANGGSDEVVKYYKYQAQSHVGDLKMEGVHDQDLAEVYYFGVRNIERNALVAHGHFRAAAEAGNARAMGMLVSGQRRWSVVGGVWTLCRLLCWCSFVRMTLTHLYDTSV